LVPFLATVLVTSLCACGGDDDVDVEPTVAVPQDTAPAPSLELGAQPEPSQPLDEQASPAQDGIITIEIKEARFGPNRWSMSLGETATIRVTNGDTQQHNMHIAGLDGEYDSQDDAVTVPEALGAGDIGELTFVPQVAGNYTFRCDFHPASMGGRIEVE
jgi:plastocyanin